MGYQRGPVISTQENQHLRDAHDHFLLASQQNYGPSQHALGVMYLQGYGVRPMPIDPCIGCNWQQSPRPIRITTSPSCMNRAKARSAT